MTNKTRILELEKNLIDELNDNKKEILENQDSSYYKQNLSRFDSAYGN